ncbi:MAG: hypothetical protein LC754_09575 [Acidobacteria bacterium]|nr:hypothetical protein [Acidobacteriota bacterium]
MIKDALVAIGTAARMLVRSWGALGILSLLYLALLASLYLFFATREATAWQLAQTALWAVAAPLLFFILQAAVANFAQDTSRPGALLKRSLADFIKILLVSLPLIALAVLVVYLLNKLQARFPASEAAAGAHAAPVVYPQKPPPTPMHWQDVVFPSLRLLLVGVLLPLAGVHLWLSVAGVGLVATLRKIHRVLARAFNAQSVFIYAVGLLVFGVIPYVLIFTRTPVKTSGVELMLFGIRLGLAFVFTLWGWIITFGALAKLEGGGTESHAVVPQGGDAPLPEAAPSQA